MICRRLLCFGISSLALLSSPPVLSSVDFEAGEPIIRQATTATIIDPSSEFRSALEIVMKKLINSYAHQVKSPLQMSIINNDIDTIMRSKALHELLSSTTAYDPTVSLGIHFEKDVISNGHSSPSCVVQYSPDGMKRLVKSYERANLFSKKEILYYIAAHEAGHCLAYHQISLGKLKQLSIKEHELLADKFAIAFLYTNNMKGGAKSVIKFNDLYSVSETHKHPEQLNAFSEYLDVLFKNDAPSSLIKNPLDIFYLATDQEDKITY